MTHSRGSGRPCEVEERGLHMGKVLGRAVSSESIEIACSGASVIMTDSCEIVAKLPSTPAV